MKNFFRTFLGNLSKINNWIWSSISESKQKRIRPFIKFLIAITLLFSCLSLYSKWNDVPKHTDVIEVSCLKYKQPTTDSTADWNPIAMITYEINTSKMLRPKLRAGDIHVRYRNWKPDKTYNPDNYPNRQSFVNDSIAINSNYWKAAKLKREIVEAKAFGHPYDKEMEELSTILSDEYSIDRLKSQLDLAAAYQMQLIDSLRLKLNDKDSLAAWIDNPTDDLYALFFFQIKCKWNISDYKNFTSDAFHDGDANAKALGFWGYQDSAYFQNHYFLRHNQNKVSISDKEKVEGVQNPLVSPNWYSLFDISQSYFDIKLLGESIDSITLKFDFVGATDFSQMDPKPDAIDMSSITFSDPVKIAQIKKNGLMFHAHFKEKDGVQKIRLFAITALTCLFTPMIMIWLVNIIVLIITGINRARRKKTHKEVLERPVIQNQTTAKTDS